MKILKNDQLGRYNELSDEMLHVFKELDTILIRYIQQVGLLKIMTIGHK